ncbi:MAG: murein L,D-transpeptidase catalytic domain family protein [Ferruginibacter sp.]|nr:murein L,D-transpeptidase catalytic domain family protein [Ferruginibacter sp.]
MRFCSMLLFALVSISAMVVYKSLRNIGSSIKQKDTSIKSVKEGHKIALARLYKYAGKVKPYVKENHLNSRFCFLIDMKIASGSKRFFMYDLVNDSILLAGLVTHGSGLSNITDSIIFSNEPGSNCTSPGKYKIGKSYYGKFGLAYKLFGLDKTNSNAFNRSVVLHAHPCVPDHEIAPLKICNSWGCPTISPIFLNQLKMYIDKPGPPILLWIVI